jgi:hypothetical protein
LCISIIAPKFPLHPNTIIKISGINLESENLINNHSDVERALGRLVDHFGLVRLTNVFKVIMAMVSDVGKAGVIRTSRSRWGNVVKQAFKTSRCLVLE